ncbi:unannotated protein [freshwater metagenome]|uniref:Unannotated protein n=1 Tax=freshwater metagenome TaxID=449393 RepID=A0A6J7RU84_9ZZZZ
MGGVAGTRCEVQKEGFLGIDCAQVEDILNGMIHQVFCEVVSLFD